MSKKVTIFTIAAIIWISFFALRAEAEEISSSQIKSKLDQILTNQKEITKKLDQIKDELQVVKIRATNK